MFGLQKPKNELDELLKRISRATRNGVVADRQFILRTKGQIRHVRIPAPLQIAGVAVLGVFAIWVAHATYTYLSHDTILSSKDATIAAWERENAELRAELAAARRSFAEATDSLEKNHKGLVSLIGQNRKLDRNLKELQSELQRITDARDKTADQNRNLNDEVVALNKQLEETKRRNLLLNRNLENVGSELADALADKSSADRHGQTMTAQVGTLKNRLASLRDAQGELLERLADSADTEIGRLTKILASTGLNVKKMVKRAGGPTVAQGGPFEPAGKNGAASDEETFDLALSNANVRLDRLETLQKLTRSLPLAAPLDYFYVSSKYGRRKDPINGKIAMHRGVDFGAKHRATIYATAPGKVTYAGWNGRFGRFLAIDHGNGVITRYGHLRRIYVKLGQEVGFRARIGQMGSSGRSTGVHLHYEIHVNGRSIDPLKFMKAGKNVFKG